MRAYTKITILDEQGEKFFGEGPYRLLKLVEQTGSLRSAALEMGMAYSKALRILTRAEQVLGYSLTTRQTGGSSGGGSRLTREGEAWLRQYGEYRTACREANEELFKRYFLPHPQTGCVVMASGMGRRFGSNKLLEELDGKKLVEYILDTVQPLFSRLVVVTRHREIEQICQRRRLQVILHDLPERSDTIRLGTEVLQAMGSEEEGQQKLQRIVFCPADQPLISTQTIETLLGQAELFPEMIWRTSCKGQPGMPVIFPAWTFEELKSLPEGKGGKALLEKYPGRVREITIDDSKELIDIDTKEDLKLFERKKE